MEGLPKKPPDCLNKAAKAEYMRMLPLFEEVGANAMDHSVVFGYCQNYTLWQEAVREMEATGGAVISTPKGQAQINPWHTVAKQAEERVVKAYKELLITPGSRKRMNIEMEKTKKKGDFFD